MLLVPVAAVFDMVKFSVKVGLAVDTLFPNVVVKSAPFSVIAGVVNAVLTVRFVVPASVEELEPTSSACVGPQKNLCRLLVAQV